MSESRPTIRIWELLLSLGGFVLLVLWAVTALTSEDPIWFWPQSSIQEPSRIVIHKQGQETVLTPDMPGFESIAEVSTQVFSRLDTINLIEVGLSDETLERYWTASVVVEFFFAEPLSFHAPFEVGDPTRLLFPVQGPHSGSGLFFRGGSDGYWFGALRMRDPETLLEALLPFTS